MDGVYFVDSVLKGFKNLQSEFIDSEKTSKKLNDIISQMCNDGLEIKSIIPVTDTHAGMGKHALIQKVLWFTMLSMRIKKQGR